MSAGTACALLDQLAAGLDVDAARSGDRMPASFIGWQIPAARRRAKIRADGTVL